MSNRKLLRNGYVITMSKSREEIDGGDVLIEGGNIVAVGKNLDATDAEILDVTGKIVTPGLVDTHTHLWESALRNIGADWVTADYMKVVRGRLGGHYEPEDIRAGTILGAAEMIDGGVTSVLDCSHNMNSPAHADAAVEGLKASGIRAVLAYGSANQDWDPQSAWTGVNSTSLSEDARRVRSEHFPADRAGLVTMALCSRGSRSTEADIHWFNDVRMALELDIPITFAAGLKNRQRERDEILALNDAGLAGPHILCYHGDRYTDEELRVLSDTGGKVTYTPEPEMRGSGSTVSTSRLRAFGLRPSLGFDVAPASSDFFGAMRAIMFADGANMRFERPKYGPPATRVGITVADVLEMATTNGAYSSWYGESVGRLVPGTKADITVFDRESMTWMPNHYPLASVVRNGHASYVEHVLIAGEYVKKDFKLVHLNKDRIVADATASKERVFVKANVPLSSQGVFEDS